jgi:hypothetical protein
MAVVKVPGLHSNYPYAQTSIQPISAGNSKKIPGLMNLIYAQATIKPTSGGSQVKPIPPLPGLPGAATGSYGFPT